MNDAGRPKWTALDTGRAVAAQRRPGNEDPPEIDDPAACVPDERPKLVRWALDRFRHSGWAAMWLSLAVLISGPPVGGSHNPAFPMPGLDPGWIAGMNMAAAKGMRYGHDIVFTYGPLAYLTVPLNLGRWQSILGILFGVLATIAVFCALYIALRRHWRRAAGPAAFATTLALTWVGPSVKALGTALIFAFLMLERRANGQSIPRYSYRPGVALAAVAALLTLVKFSDGAVATALAGLVALCESTWRTQVRNAGAALATYVVVFVTLWLAAGQNLADIPAWTRGSIEVSAGYPEAMGLRATEFKTAYGLALGLAALTVILAIRALSRRKGMASVGVGLTALLALEFGFKHGFTRQDLTHEFTFWAMAGLALIALSRWFPRPGPVLAAAMLSLLMIPQNLPQIDPFAARNQWRSAIELQINHHYRSAKGEEYKRQARHSYELPASMLAQIGQNPVHINPWEITLAWAYDLNWAPAPVIQDYSAYTPYLDKLNARHIEQAPASQMVLRHTNTIDGRNIHWETPRFLISLACNYSVSSADGSWTLLRHSTNRCSAPRVLDARPVAAGETIVPPTVGANEILVTHFQPDPVGAAPKLVRVVLKDFSEIRVVTDTGDYRLPEGLAGGPLLTTFPARLGWSKPFDGFRYRSLAFNHSGTVEFKLITLTW